jgi:hypothetical protein
VQGSLSPDPAKAFAAMLITSVEGAVALSRAAQSPEVFDTTATMLLDQLKSLVAATSVSPSGGTVTAPDGGNDRARPQKIEQKGQERISRLAARNGRALLSGR